MTQVLESSGQDKTINIIAFKDPVSGAVPAICVKIDKNEQKLPVANEKQDDDNILSSSTLATCRKKYPSGCTIMECRLDASNRPVAHVLQVPGDSDSVSSKMSVLVEAKQTPSGSYSRITSCPIKDTCESSNDPECSKNGVSRTNALESGNASNNDNNKEEPDSKILCKAMIGETKESSDRQRGSQESPEITYVECDQTKTNGFAENIAKQQETVYRAPPNCEDTCLGSRKYLTERRNGLDASDYECMLRSNLEKPAKTQNRVCPLRCCEPIVISAQEKPKPTTCPNPTAVSRQCSKDTFSPSPSQDSLERFKNYVSTNQWEKYRACRSKRNGLQDECYLPLPRHLLESEKPGTMTE